MRLHSFLIDYHHDRSDLFQGYIKIPATRLTASGFHLEGYSMRSSLWMEVGGWLLLLLTVTLNAR